MVTEEENINPTVFVVKNDTLISELLKHILTGRGYKVYHARDGREAAVMLEEIEVPQLILLDIIMPFLDGFELLHRIRIKNQWSETPIIILTSKGQKKDIDRAFNAGANDYIVKPFRPKELMARVSHFIK